MPFLLHKDTALTEEIAASDYEKWLNADTDIDGEQEGDEGPSSRQELVRVPQQDNRRFEN